ncbi:hypothetical protein [Stappia sp. WLB 29]|uniref:hypothetical protein n=1 Tax=Stappia sp. WLB 29 TaxID=2925220 RepID=UPI0020BF543D|nr:hypothetical protein [Stappia sp. WLB 29]
MSFDHHAGITARYRRYRRLNLRAAAGIVSGTAIALVGAGFGSDQVVLAGSLVTMATTAAAMTVDIVWARRDRVDPVWRHAPGFSPSHYQLYRTGDGERSADRAKGDPAGLVAARAPLRREHRPAMVIDPHAGNARVIDELAETDEDHADAEQHAATAARGAQADCKHEAGGDRQLIPLVERLARPDPRHSDSPNPTLPAAIQPARASSVER